MRQPAPPARRHAILQAAAVLQRVPAAGIRPVRLTSGRDARDQTVVKSCSESQSPTEAGVHLLNQDGIQLAELLAEI